MLVNAKKRKPKPKFRRRGRKKHNIVNPLRMDPSRTAGLRRRLITDLRQKFNRIALAIADLIEKEDAFDLGKQTTSGASPFQPIANARYGFLSNPRKLEAFRKWLKTLLETQLTGRSDQELWQRFIQSGFEQGAKRSFDDVRKRAIDAGNPLDEQKLAWYGGNKEEFLRSSFAQPVAREKVELLATRSYGDLDDITTTMSNRMSRTLASGMTRGLSPREVARELVDEVGLSKRRAETIARTEIIRAHAQGQLMALEQLGVKELGVMVEWSTTGDDRVCDLCAPLQGVVLKIEEAQDMLPRHPNCRCAWVPANVGEDEELQIRKKGAVEDALEESEELAGDDWGPDIEIAKERPRSILNSLYRFRELLNAFCPTGEGGGIDASCPPKGGKGTVTVDPKSPEKQLEKAAEEAVKDPEIKAAIKEYTKEGYSELNKSMRSCPPSYECLGAEQKATLDKIESAIEAAPKFSEPITVFRGIDRLPPAVSKELANELTKKQGDGSLFSMGSIVSTSTKDPGDDGSAFVENPPANGQVLFSIKAKSGLYVEGITQTKGEHELLQSSKTKYKVANVKKTLGGGWMVHLEEHE